MGRHFKAKIDRDNLKYFLDQMLCSEEKQKWSLRCLIMTLKLSIRKGTRIL